MKTNQASKSRAVEHGSATIMMIALLAIMFILISANTRTLLGMQKELKLIERKQIQRLNKKCLAASGTNRRIQMLLKLILVLKSLRRRMTSCG